MNTKLISFPARRHWLLLVVLSCLGWTISGLEVHAQCNLVPAPDYTAFADANGYRVLVEGNLEFSPGFAPTEDQDGDGLSNIVEFNGWLVSVNGGATNNFGWNSTVAGRMDGSCIQDPDSDNDGLSDLLERDNGTNPRSADSDGDGMGDAWEVHVGLGPTDDGTVNPDNDPNADPDGDGLGNNEERLGKDGLYPPSELEASGGDPITVPFFSSGGPDFTLPLNYDSDGDELVDSFEYPLVHNLDPLVAEDQDADPDLDGLTTYREQCIHPLLAKFWGVSPRLTPFPPNQQPSITPALESQGYGGYNRQMLVASGYLNLAEFDKDDDTYNEEDPPGSGTFTNSLGGVMWGHPRLISRWTNPSNPDTDGDDLPDGWELEHGLNTLSGDLAEKGVLNLSSLLGDPDGDGLFNIQEYFGADGYRIDFITGTGDETNPWIARAFNNTHSSEFALEIGQVGMGSEADRAPQVYNLELALLSKGFKSSYWPTNYPGFFDPAAFSANVFIPVPGVPPDIDISFLRLQNISDNSFNPFATSVSGILFVDDSPSNNKYDSGEKLWSDNGDGQFITGDDVSMGGSPVDGDIGISITANSPVLFPMFGFDTDNDGLSDSYEIQLDPSIGKFPSSPVQPQSPYTKRSARITNDGGLESRIFSPTVDGRRFFSRDFTIECWVFLEDFGTNEYEGSFIRGDVFLAGSLIRKGFDLGVEPAGAFKTVPYVSFETAGGFRYKVEAKRPLPVGRWVHLAGVFDHRKNSLGLFVDGLLEQSLQVGEESATFFGRFNGGQLVMAQKGPGGQPFANHLWIDEVRVWGSPRSADEISANSGQLVEPVQLSPFDIYNFEKPNTLFAYYSFDDGGDSAEDMVRRAKAGLLGYAYPHDAGAASFLDQEYFFADGAFALASDAITGAGTSFVFDGNRTPLVSGRVDAERGALDSDGDGLPDDWEIIHEYNPFKQNTPDHNQIEEYDPAWAQNESALADADKDDDDDGLTNIYEYWSRTNPRQPDTDEDTLEDAVEDFDEDGINNGIESDENSRPDYADTDDDEFTDAQELANSTLLNLSANPIRTMALRFDGYPGTHVTVPERAELRLGSWTLEASVLPDKDHNLADGQGASVIRRVVQQTDNGLFAANFELRIVNVGGILVPEARYIYVDNTGQGNIITARGETNDVNFTIATTATGTNLVNFTRIAATYDEVASSLKVYVEGFLVKTFTIPTTSPPVSGEGPFVYTRIGEGYRGDISDVRIWDQTLSQAELTAIIDGGEPAFPGSPLSWFTMNDGGFKSTTDVGYARSDIIRSVRYVIPGDPPPLLADLVEGDTWFAGGQVFIFESGIVKSIPMPDPVFSEGVMVNGGAVDDDFAYWLSLDEYYRLLGVNWTRWGPTPEVLAKARAKVVDTKANLAALQAIPAAQAPAVGDVFLTEDMRLYTYIGPDHTLPENWIFDPVNTGDRFLVTASGEVVDLNVPNPGINVIADAATLGGGLYIFINNVGVAYKSDGTTWKRWGIIPSVEDATTTSDWNNQWLRAATISGHTKFIEYSATQEIILQDGDEDGLPDQWEIIHGLDPNDPTGDNGPEGDPDNDGLTNLYEYWAGLGPNCGVLDPLSEDSDGDNIIDYDEDCDGDGISNGVEQDEFGTLPHFADTDDDSLKDGHEVLIGMNPANSLSPLVDRVAEFAGTPQCFVRMPADDKIDSDEARLALGEFTLDAWVFPRSVNNDIGEIVTRTVNESTGYENFSLGLTSNRLLRLRFTIENGSGTEELIAPPITALPLGTWSHVRGVFDSSTQRIFLYLNGELVAVKNTTHQPMIAGPATFKPVTRAGRNFDGYLDEIRIWDIIAGATTIEDLSAALTGDEAGLVTYYRFDDGTSSNLTAVSCFPGLDHGHVEDFVSVYARNWEKNWDNAGTLEGGASIVDALPNTPVQDSLVDQDGDGIPDWWELEYFPDLDTAGPGDVDGYTDSDGDGLNDYYEYLAGLNPDDQDTDDNGVQDGDEDPDGDGLTNIDEQEAGTDPLIGDSDEDGLKDGMELNNPTPSSPLYSMSPQINRSLDLNAAGFPVDGIVIANNGRFDLGEVETIDAGTGIAGEEELPQNGWTIESWVKPVGGTQTGIIIAHTIDNGLAQYELGLNAGMAYAKFDTHLGVEVKAADINALPVGEWAHLAGVWNPDMGELILYVNGTRRFLVDTDEFPVVGHGEVRLGASAGPGLWDAMLDEVRVHKGYRTQLMIDLARNRFFQPGGAGLVAYYRFDDGGTRIEDFAYPHPNLDAEAFELDSAPYGIGVAPDGAAFWVVPDGHVLRGFDYTAFAGFNDDSDGDGLADWWESLYGLDPSTSDSLGDETLDGDRDPDDDGLYNKYEFLSGTRPDKQRTDGSTLDTETHMPDGDGVKNLFEQDFGSDPRYSDTDEDGVSDKDEIFGSPLRPIAEWPLSDPADSRDPVVRRGGVFGAADRVVVPPQAKFALPSWTIEAWVRPDAGFAANSIIFRRAVQGIGGANELLNYELGLLNDGGTLRPYVQFGDRGSPSRAYADTAVVPADGTTYTHMAGSYDASARELKLYLDGMPVAHLEAEDLVDALPPIAGSEDAEVTLGGGFIGAIDEVRVWGLSLSDDAVFERHRTTADSLSAATTSEGGSGGTLSITPTTDPDLLLSALLAGGALPPGISNVSLTFIGTEANEIPAGTYTGFPALPESIPLGNGVLFASGAALDALGPNESASTTGVLGVPGDPDLDTLAEGFGSFDAVGLLLQFTAAESVNRLSFDFVFGSEEYPEYVGSPFNDAFAAFLDGVNISFDENGLPVTVNNNFFQLDNDPWDPDLPANIGKTPVDINIEYDGLTPVLRTTADITPGVHTLKLIISDLGDSVLDSGVFLTGLSFGQQGAGLVASYRFDDDGSYIQDFAEANLRCAVEVTAAMPVGVNISDIDYDFAEMLGDSDGDWIPDWWELGYKLNPNQASDAMEDPDLDTLYNLYENQAGTHPRRPDTDFDGLTDELEDSDTDGLNNTFEQHLGSSPGTYLTSGLEDTDDDGFNDQVEVGNFTLPADSMSPRIERVLELDGGLGYVELPNHPRLRLEEDWTVEAWFSLSLSDNDGGIILQRMVRYDNAVDTINYEIGVDASRYIYARMVGEDGIERLVKSQAPIPDGSDRWRHVAATYDAATRALRLYVNGIEEDVLAGGADVKVPAVGVTQIRMGLGFGGQIEDVRIWKRTLDAQDLALIDNQALAGDESDLVAYYRFNDGGTTAQDFHLAYIRDWCSGFFHAATLAPGANMVPVFDSPVANFETDTDNDGLPDAWEFFYFGDLSQTGTGDPDGDGLSNINEYYAMLNPSQFDTFLDGIQDGLRDTDGDGLNNIDEQNQGTLPDQVDTDDDGLTDHEELFAQDDTTITPDLAPEEVTNPLRSLDPLKQLSLKLNGSNRMLIPPQGRHSMESWTIQAWVCPLSAPAENTDAVVIRRAITDLANDVRAINYELGIHTKGGIVRPYVQYVGISDGVPVTIRVDGTQPEEVSNVNLVDPVVPLDGEFHHLAATYDPETSELELFVDGDRAAYRIDAVELPLLGVGPGIEIGSETTVGGGSMIGGAVENGFNGYIDEVRLLTGAISDEAVLAEFVDVSSSVARLNIAAPSPPDEVVQLSPSEAVSHNHQAGELLVCFNEHVTPGEVDAIAAEMGAEVIKRFDIIPVYHLRITDNSSVSQKMSQFLNRGDLAYVEPNYQVQALRLPNDAQFNQLWGLNNTGQSGGTADADIDAPEAWDTTVGSREIVVAVIDTGIDYTHPDLAANMWINDGEVPGNGIDDDNNGFVDDVYGYDFANNDGDPQDGDGHGTHVAGTIGAIGDNAAGVVGVNWNVRLMALKFITNVGGTTDDAIKAIDYATQMGAHLSNNSWGGGGFSQALKDAIDRARQNNNLFVAAAGNDGSDNDAVPSYPASYDLPNIVSVAATDRNDLMASFSNYGAESVDIGAPGVAILSTTPGNNYEENNGTSMASPHVAGAAALVLSRSPGLSFEALKATLLGAADPIDSLDGRVLTGARLNAATAVAGGAAGVTAYFSFNDGSSRQPALAEDFTMANDWVNGWRHAGILENGAVFSSNKFVEIAIDDPDPDDPDPDPDPGTGSDCPINEPLDSNDFAWEGGAFNNENGSIINDPAKFWSCQSNEVFEGVSALCTGTRPDPFNPVLGNSETSWVQTKVQGPGELCFAYKVSSESPTSEDPGDLLRFYINGTLQATYSGNQAEWATACFTIPTGITTLKWQYEKDDFLAMFDDAAYLDNIVFTPDSTTVLCTSSTPSQNAVVTELRPTLTWCPEEEATWYQIWINKNGQKFLSTWLQQTEGAFTPGVDFPCGSYQWWSQAWSPTAGLSAWSAANSFERPCCIPQQPELDSPVVCDQGYGNITYSWETVQCATWYQIYISKDGQKFLSTWINAEGVSGLASQTLGGHGYGNYQWWIQPWGPDGIGPWSSGLSFTLGGVEASSLAGNELCWSEALCETDATWIQVWINRNGVTFLSHWFQPDQASGNCTILPKSAMPGQYKVWMRTWNAGAGMGPWSGEVNLSAP